MVNTAHPQEIEQKSPLMYKGYVIRRVDTPKGKRFEAYNFQEGVYLNPNYTTWDALRTVIDATKPLSHNVKPFNLSQK